jgi:hypothetical protein
MSIHTSTTSFSVTPASVLELAQLVRNPGADADTDRALFLAALVRQLEAATSGTAPELVENGRSIASAEGSDPPEDVLQALLQYVSNLDALSARPLEDGTGGSGVPAGGNSLPETASLLAAHSDSGPLSADQVPPELAAFLAPPVYSDRPPASGGLSGKVTDPDDLLTLADGEKLSGGDAGVLYQSRREGSGSAAAEMSSFGTAASDAKEPDALLSQVLAAEPEGADSEGRAGDEHLFSRFDQKLAGLTKTTAEVALPALERGIPVEGMPSTAQPSAVSVGDSVPALDRPLNQTGWQDALGERILWMTDKNLKAAEIKVNPAHLGPLEIRIRMEQDQASVHFATHDASVREAIEAAAPKLREMLGAREINLADINVTVSSGPSDERGAPAEFGRQPDSGDRSRLFKDSVAAKNEDVPPGSGQAVASNGLLNLYA